MVSANLYTLFWNYSHTRFVGLYPHLSPQLLALLSDQASHVPKISAVHSLLRALFIPGPPPKMHFVSTSTDRTLFSLTRHMSNITSVKKLSMTLQEESFDLIKQFVNTAVHIPQTFSQPAPQLDCEDTAGTLFFFVYTNTYQHRIWYKSWHFTNISGMSELMSVLKMSEMGSLKGYFETFCSFKK